MDPEASSKMAEQIKKTAKEKPIQKKQPKVPAK